MRAGGWRWAVVAAGSAALLVAPLAVGALPARESRLSAAELLDRVQRSASAGYSGYAEAVGGLVLPLTDAFSSVTDLFGDRTRLRVWWRSRQDWRVDTLRPTGEVDRYGDAGGVWTWDYERARVTWVAEPPVRLPRAGDLDPAALGRRLLSEADPAGVSRLPARRVAGRSAPGLRLRPAPAPRTGPGESGTGTTIGRVDVWVDAGSGVPLRVEVYGVGAARPVVDTAFLDVDLRAPDAATTRFTPPAGARISGEARPDLAAAIDAVAVATPPAELAGLPLRRRVDGLGSVGTYGTGLTVLVAVPLPGRLTGRLRGQLADAPGATTTAAGTRLAVGPLTLLLTDPPARRSWLLTGTVPAATLDRAAAELAALPPEPDP